MGKSPTQAIEEAIANNEGLGEATKSHYLTQFRILVQLGGGSATTVFRSPEKVYEAMRERYAQPLTRKSLLAVARALVGHLPAIGEKFPNAAGKYGELIKRDDEESGTSERMLDGRLSEREENVYTPWAKVVEARDRTEEERGPGALETLLVSMYVLMEPLRQDYGNVCVLENDSTVDKLDSKQNYLILPPEGGDSEEVTLVLRTYKTAKRYGEFKRLVPTPLVKIIRASMTEQPRDYLFVDSRGKQFLKRNSFVKWSNRCLETAFGGRRVTVNTLRHSYISSIDFNSRTPGELMRTSRMMGHSMGMQQMYRRLPDKEGSGDAAQHAKTQVAHATEAGGSNPAPHPPPKARAPPSASDAPAKKKHAGGIVVIPPRSRGAVGSVSPRPVARRGVAADNQVTIRI